MINDLIACTVLLSQKLINQNNSSVISMCRKQCEDALSRVDVYEIRYAFGPIIESWEYSEREGNALMIYAIGVPS